MKYSPFLVAAALAFPATAAAQTDLGPLNLPGSSIGLPLSEGFEVAAGTVPGYMAVTQLDVATLTFDPEAWCNIGQLAPCIDPFAGSFCLEMGLDPAASTTRDVRNALVISIDPTGYTGDMTISALAQDWGEETDTVDGIWLSSDGTNWYALDTPWSNVVAGSTWESTDAYDLTSTAVDVSSPFYLAFCQEDNFQYQNLDGVSIDNINVPAVEVGIDLGPLNLPTSSIGLPLTEDFDTAAGTVPGYMALSAFDPSTGLPDPDAFCNIGNVQACIDPFSGAFNLEMGKVDNPSGFGDMRNAMVLMIDGAGYTGSQSISFMAYDYADEDDPVDGCFISADGLEWFDLYQDWGDFPSEWSYSGGLQLDSTPVDTSGVFYLAFCQEDNATFNTGGDGVAIDDISIPAKPFLAPPALTAGAFTVLELQSAFVNRPAKFLASTKGAGPTVVQGVTLALSPPILTLADTTTDVDGNSFLAVKVPAGLAGANVWLQSVIVESGQGFTSNGVAATVN